MIWKRRRPAPPDPEAAERDARSAADEAFAIYSADRCYANGMVYARACMALAEAQVALEEAKA